MSPNPEYAIETAHLTKLFRKRPAVDDLTLRVPAGSVFAFLGRNGAGKTTTIRMLLNLLDRTSGEARLLGLDSIKDSLEVKKVTGYVAEGQKMYDWMRVDEIIWFCRQFHQDWDDDFAAHLKGRLELDGKAQIGQLSRGTQAKVALLLALSYRPPLLILDEPTAGLDVVVRRNFIEGVIELTQEEGRTVFFSSHQVNEVERIADWVGIMHEGRLVACSSVEDLKSDVKRLILTFDGTPGPFSSIPGFLDVENGGRQAAVVVKGFSDETVAAARALGAKTVDVEGLGLEDIFVALVGRGEVK